MLLLHEGGAFSENQILMKVLLQPWLGFDKTWSYSVNWVFHLIYVALMFCICLCHRTNTKVMTEQSAMVPLGFLLCLQNTSQTYFRQRNFLLLLSAFPFAFLFTHITSLPLLVRDACTHKRQPHSRCGGNVE